MSNAILSKFCLPRSSISSCVGKLMMISAISDRISSNDGEEDEDDHQSQPHLIQPHLTTLVIPFLSQGLSIVLTSGHLGHASKFSCLRGKLKTSTSSINVFAILSGGKMQNGQKIKQ